MKTIVLLSGGLDSTTTLYWSIKQGWDVVALTFDIAQASRMDIKTACNISSLIKVPHTTLPLSFYDKFSIHPLLPSSKDGKSISRDYLPVRNMIFYSIAAGWAESIGADQIISGSTLEDGINLPDAKIEFYGFMNQILRFGTRSGVVGQPIRIIAPLIEKTHPEIIQLAIDLKVPVELTWSCFNDEPPACGKCRSCQSRLTAFQKLRLTDPIPYAEGQD